MEILDIVDESGNPTGKTVDRETAHRNGIRHRTSHVWIVRQSSGSAQVLLQKRSMNKDSYPGCYDISSAGHIPSGESFTGSAVRELKEELGVCASEDELIFCGRRRFSYTKTFHGKLFCDNQVSNVYILFRDAECGSFILQKSEIDEVRWMDINQCINMVLNNKFPNCIHMEELRMISSKINSLGM